MRSTEAFCPELRRVDLLAAPVSCSIEGNGIRDSAGAMDLISQVRFSGLTPLGTAMEQKILNPLVVRPAKASRLAVRTAGTLSKGNLP